MLVETHHNKNPSIRNASAYMARVHAAHAAAAPPPVTLTLDSAHVSISLLKNIHKFDDRYTIPLLNINRPRLYTTRYQMSINVHYNICFFGVLSINP